MYNLCSYRNPSLNWNPSFPHTICLYFPIYNLYSRSHNPSLLQFESDNNSTYGAINSLMWTRNSFFFMSSPNSTRVISLPHDVLNQGKSFSNVSLLPHVNTQLFFDVKSQPNPCDLASTRRSKSRQISL
jgi:hypothetical protein